MVAEPVTETELPTTEVADAPTPEPVEQPAVDEDLIPEEAVSAFLKEKGILAEGTSPGDGDDSPAEDSGPDLSKLSPQQILELGKQQGMSEAQSTQSRAAYWAQQRERIEGARNVLAYSKPNMERKLIEAGNGAELIRDVLNSQDQLHGAWNLIWQADVAAAQENGMNQLGQQVRGAAQQVLGAKAKNGFGEFDTLPPEQQTPQAFMKAIADKAREGYVSPAEHAAGIRKAVAQAINSLPKEARDKAGFNGSTTNTGSARNGGSGITYQQAVKNPKLAASMSDDEYFAMIEKS